MKKIFLCSAIAFMGLISCSDDDDSGAVDNPVQTDTEEEAVAPEVPGNSPGVNTPELVDRVVLNEFNTEGNWVELANVSGADVDVSSYILCLGPGTYRSLSELSILSGDLTIPAGGFLVVNYNLTTEGGLGLYENGSDFTNPETLLDFVQYGTAGSVREDVAVAAGIWTLNDVVELPTDSSASLAYDGAGNSSSDWSVAAVPTVGIDNASEVSGDTVVLNEFSLLVNIVELTNVSDTAVDVSNYYLCLGPGTYSAIGDLRIISGTTTIAPGEFLVVEYDLPDSSGGLGLYVNNSGFGNSDNIIDFVQYGASGTSRENVAVAAGIWTLNDVVPLPARTSSIAFDGSGNSASDWTELTSVTFAEANF